jgi:hypothetical protein
LTYYHWLGRQAFCRKSTVSVIAWIHVSREVVVYHHCDLYSLSIRLLSLSSRSLLGFQCGSRAARQRDGCMRYRGATMAPHPFTHYIDPEHWFLPRPTSSRGSCVPKKATREFDVGSTYGRVTRGRLSFIEDVAPLVPGIHHQIRTGVTKFLNDRRMLALIHVAMRRWDG